MNAKKEAPRTAATGKGANTVHTTEHDSGNWPDGQEVYCRITLGLWYEIRKNIVKIGSAFTTKGIKKDPFSIFWPLPMKSGGKMESGRKERDEGSGQYEHITTQEVQKAAQAAGNESNLRIWGTW